MALTKANIVQAIQDRNGYNRSQASDLVEIVLELIKGSLAEGEDVLISNFGKFRVNEKAERWGRNPATGEKMVLEPRRTVTFKCSGKLREVVNS